MVPQLQAKPQAGAKLPPDRSAVELRGCRKCHRGIEPMRPKNTGMGGMIHSMGQAYGDWGGCVICHGGTPAASTVTKAHQGVPAGMAADGPVAFYRDPGAAAVVQRTCGQGACHFDYPARVRKSLMSRRAQSVTIRHANNIDSSGSTSTGSMIYDRDGTVPTVGSAMYRHYMAQWQENTSGAVTVVTVQKEGISCSACHVDHAFSGSGRDVGQAFSDSTTIAGHLKTHRLMATREASKGIGLRTCLRCHGSAEKPIIAQQIIHSALLCQDCHTTIDVHGDGNMAANTNDQVEVECQDCHGTVAAPPWQLPLGVGDEGGFASSVTVRGVSRYEASWASVGTSYPRQGGYLLTARGNAFGNVVKTGTGALLHSAGGEDIEVPLLANSKKHPQEMANGECRTCHSEMGDWHQFSK